MSIVELEILADLEFNELVTLNVIKRDDDLIKMLALDLVETVDDLILLQGYNSLNDKHKDVIREFFDDLILTNQKHIDLYEKLVANPVMLVTNKTATKEQVAEVTAKTLVPSPVKEVKEPVAKPAPVAKATPVDKAKALAEGKLPRRYGKNDIMKDIAKQGGVPTLDQKTALKVNDLKNIYVRLSAMGIKNMLTDKKVLSDQDNAEIISAIVIVEQKLAKILKLK